MSKNDKLVESAVAGDMEPLLKKLREDPGVTFSGPKSDGLNPGEPPEDSLWLTVLNARADGELSSEQFTQCYEAMRSKYGSTDGD